MPRHKAPGTGRDFKPGHPGGPGRPPLPKELHEAKKLTAASFQAAVHKLSSMSVEQLKEHAKTKDCTVLEAMIIGQVNAAMKGKTSPISFLLDRVIGPLKQQFEIKGDLTIGGELSQMTPEQKRDLLKEINATLSNDTETATGGEP